jgi:hypothetical protein
MCQNTQEDRRENSSLRHPEKWPLKLLKLNRNKFGSTVPVSCGRTNMTNQ